MPPYVPAEEKCLFADVRDGWAAAVSASPRGLTDTAGRENRGCFPQGRHALRGLLREQVPAGGFGPDLLAVAVVLTQVEGQRVGEVVAQQPVEDLAGDLSLQAQQGMQGQDRRRQKMSCERGR